MRPHKTLFKGIAIEAIRFSKVGSKNGKIAAVHISVPFKIAIAALGQAAIGSSKIGGESGEIAAVDVAVIVEIAFAYVRENTR